MPTQPREMEGAIFPNDKGDNPKRPDHRGRCQIHGTNLEISAWERTSRSGKSYLSLAFRTESEREQSPGTAVVTEVTQVPGNQEVAA